MSTRSPQNKRTQAQLQGERTGMARKSASSAKPARAAAGSVRMVASSGKAKRQQMERGEDLSGLSREEKRARKQERRLQEDRVYSVSNLLMKEDFEYNRHRKVWWGLLIAAIAFIAGTWVSMMIVPTSEGTLVIPQMVGVVVTYALIIIAFIYDFVKIRPIRNKFRAVAEGMSEAKLNAVLERTAAAEDAKRAAKEAKKSAK